MPWQMVCCNGIPPPPTTPAAAAAVCRYDELIPRVLPMVVDGQELFDRAIANDKTVLVEGEAGPVAAGACMCACA